MLENTPLFTATFQSLLPKTKGHSLLELRFQTVKVRCCLFPVKGDTRWTQSWAVELFLELELGTGLQTRKRNQECRQVPGELSLTRIVEGGQALGGMFVWGYLCRNTYDENLMSWGAQNTVESSCVMLPVVVRGVVMGARTLHPWTVSMLMGAWIRVGVAQFIRLEVQSRCSVFVP